MRSRQLEILQYLVKVKKSTYRELMEKFEISKRTAIRDIDALSSMGIPIYSQPGCHGGIFIPEDYKIERTFFTREELSSIVFALHLTKNIHVEKLEQSVLRKLELMDPELISNREKRYDDRVQVELIPDPICTNPEIWKVIDEALDRKMWVTITMEQRSYVVRPMNYIISREGLLLRCASLEAEYTLPVLDMTDCVLTMPPLEEASARRELPGTAAASRRSGGACPAEGKSRREAAAF